MDAEWGGAAGVAVVAQGTAVQDVLTEPAGAA